MDLGDQHLSIKTSSPLKSRRMSNSKRRESSTKKDSIELSRIKKEFGDYHITNSWDSEVFAPLSFMEKKILKNLQ